MVTGHHLSLNVCRNKKQDDQICAVMSFSNIYGLHVPLWFLTTSGLLMGWWTRAWGISSHIWIRASMSCWIISGAILQHHVQQYIMFQWCSVGFRSGKHGASNGIHAFDIQELPSHSAHTGQDIFPHHKEPRAHCTSIRSNIGSDKFILVPKSSLATGVLSNPPKTCLPRSSLTPEPNWSCWMMSLMMVIFKENGGPLVDQPAH